jgi:hypothetical protein
MLGAHLFGLLNVFQAGLELVAGSSGSSPIFSVYRGMERCSLTASGTPTLVLGAQVVNNDMTLGLCQTAMA